MQFKYYFQAETGLLIRVDITNTMTNQNDNSIYRNYYIETNLVRINDQTVGNNPNVNNAIGSNSGLDQDTWIWISIGIVAVAIGAAVIVWYWRKATKSTLPVTGEPKASVPSEDVRNTAEGDHEGSDITFDEHAFDR